MIYEMVSNRIVPDETSGNVATSKVEGGSGHTKNTGTAVNEKQSRQRKHHHRRHHRRGSKDGAGSQSNNADTASDGEGGGGRDDKFKLLVEFIPYVGLGDATRDNMVHSSLP